MSSRILLICAVLLLAMSGTAIAMTLHMEQATGILISPGYTFVMPDSPASLSFTSNVTLSGFYIGPSNLTLGSLGVLVTQTPSSSPSIPMTVSTFSPSASSGDALAWVSDIGNGSLAQFTFTGLLVATTYEILVDNSTHGTLDGPTVGFTWASGGTHFFEVSVFTAAPTLDSNAMIFLFGLIVSLTLGISGLVIEVPFVSVMGGLVGVAFGFWLWTETGVVWILITGVFLGIFFMVMGIAKALEEVG